MPDAALGGIALFLAHHADGLTAEAAEAGNQRLVLAELAVAGERGEFGDQALDEVVEMRPLRMPRDQRLLPRRQVQIEVGQRLRRLVLDLPDLLGDIGARGRKRPQLVDLGVELGDRLFEVEIAAHVIWHQLNIARTGRGVEAGLDRRKEM